MSAQAWHYSTAMPPDSAYKLLFSHTELVRDLLVQFVPVVRAENLKFDSLQRVNASYVADGGQQRHSDVVWKIRLADNWLYLYLLLEFQSAPDPLMALRMHVYLGLLLQDLCRRKEFGPSGKLPWVL